MLADPEITCRRRSCVDRPDRRDRWFWLWFCCCCIWRRREREADADTPPTPTGPPSAPSSPLLDWTPPPPATDSRLNWSSSSAQSAARFRSMAANSAAVRSGTYVCRHGTRRPTTSAGAAGADGPADEGGAAASAEASLTWRSERESRDDFSLPSKSPTDLFSFERHQFREPPWTHIPWPRIFLHKKERKWRERLIFEPRLHTYASYWSCTSDPSVTYIFLSHYPWKHAWYTHE